MNIIAQLPVHPHTLPVPTVTHPHPGVSFWTGKVRALPKTKDAIK